MTKAEREYIIDKLWSIRQAYSEKESKGKSDAWEDILDFVEHLKTED